MEQHLYIIRHGETDYNRKGIIQGRGVDTSLNDEGRKQAEQFYQEYGKYPFEKIYTSSLKRSQESVAGFIKRGIPWEAKPELDEIDWGEQEGKATSVELRKLYRKVTRAWRQGKTEVRIPGGESAQDLADRLQQFVNYLDPDNAQHILICTHGRAMRALLCVMLGDDLRNMEEYPHANLSLYRVLKKNGSYYLHTRHDTDHLKG